MRIKLVSFTENDFDRLLSWVSSAKELRQWAGPTIFTWPLNKEQLTTYLSCTVGEFPEALIYKAVIDDDRVVGHVEFDKIDWNEKTAFLCRFLIGPEYRGQGLGYALIDAMLEMDFNALSLHELILHVYAFNVPVIRCYEQAGFKTVEVIKLQGDDYAENWDTIRMSFLVSDFKKGQ